MKCADEMTKKQTKTMQFIQCVNVCKIEIENSTKKQKSKKVKHGKSMAFIKDIH